MKREKTVDTYIKNATHWQDELVKLRKVLTGTNMEECVKWGAPCYTHNGKNVIGLGAFKSYVGLWFFQGGLLKDPNKVLTNAQPGKTKAMRQWRFTSAKDIKITPIKAYIKEAIALADSSKEIRADRSKPVTIPPELRAALAKNKKASTAFKDLTKGKQREYADYVADAKRAETKQSRLRKILPMISRSNGLNDKYRK